MNVLLCCFINAYEISFLWEKLGVWWFDQTLDF